MTANRQPSQETRPQSATIDALPNHTLQAKTFSLLPIALAIAVGTLLPSSASFAAKHPAAAKPAAHKKAAAAANHRSTPIPQWLATGLIGGINEMVLQHIEQDQIAHLPRLSNQAAAFMKNALQTRVMEPT